MFSFAFFTLMEASLLRFILVFRVISCQGYVVHSYPIITNLLCIIYYGVMYYWASWCPVPAEVGSLLRTGRRALSLRRMIALFGRKKGGGARLCVTI